MINIIYKFRIHFVVQVLVSSLLVMMPAIAISETFNVRSFLGVGDEDTNFKSYRPSYFGYRVNHSDENQEGEIKFRLSLKYQITQDDVTQDMPLVNALARNWYFAYTQKSFWSIQESSQPFRESNFSPEFFKEIQYSRWDSDDVFKLLRFGLYQHESTGEAGVGSHGWNITYLEPIFKYGKFTLAPKLWAPVFFRSKDKAAPDNPDIFDYYGYGEIKLFYEQTDDFKHSVMYRQGDNSDLYGFRWQTDFALRGRDWNPKIFFQFWSGYGESLKDYNNKTHGFVIGLSAVH